MSAAIRVLEANMHRLLLLLLHVLLQREWIPPSSLLALPIALEHPALSTSPHVLCAATAVCKDWRQAVHQCAACNTDVKLKLNQVPVTTEAAAFQLLPKLTSFAGWLAKHGGLVRSLTIGSWEPRDENTTTVLSQVAVPLLCQAMQLAAATCSMHPRTTVGPTAATESAAAAAAVVAGRAAQQHQQQPPGLRLASFSSDGFWAAGLLPVLPAHSLTRLELNFTYPEQHAREAQLASTLTAALPRLSNLHQLVISGRAADEFGSCLSGLGQLSRLTRLELMMGGIWGRFVQQLLPQPPPLRVLHIELDGPFYSDMHDAPLDLGCLQQLQEFKCRGSLPQELVLPAQLRHLELGECYNSEQLTAVMPLQQLSALSFSLVFEVFEGYECFENHEPLLRLAQLPALQQLRLSVFDKNFAITTAPAWGQLPQLCELQLHAQDDEISVPDDDVSTQQLAVIVAGVAAATALTRLYLEFPDCISLQPDVSQHAATGAEAGQQQEPLDVCASIAGLTGLKHLEVLNLQHIISPTLLASGRQVLVPGDVTAFTALTGLTCLELCGGGACVGDIDVATLACYLKQLRKLDLSGCILGSMACLGPIAHMLPQLTALWLQGNPGITQQGLMVLTRLSKLQRLEVYMNDEVTAEVVDNF
jgi:hypothetical protein